MSKYYTFKYRLPGQIFWRKIKKVVHRSIDDFTHPGLRQQLIDKGTQPKLRSWVLKCDNGDLYFVPLDSEVKLGRDHVEFNFAQMEKQAKQPIQRED